MSFKVAKALGRSLFLVCLLTGLLWARARDPFQREWFSVRTSSGEAVSAAVVMPDRGGPFPVVVWCHGAGGSLAGDGEALRQFASLGMAAVGFEYDKTNQAGFDAQFAAVLDEVVKKSWAARQPLTPSLSPSDGERVAEGRVRGASSTINYEPSTKLAWVGHSLGAQRQLSFLARHPERQPVALVRLNGGMVEELRAEEEHRTSNIEHRTSKEGEPSPDPRFAKATEDRPSQEGNRQPATALHAWLAHGENDEIFPASDARAVAEWLTANGASVELDVYPGRGHGFGEDQPLLVRRAAEFCANQLGATIMVPDTVRTSHWYWWTPTLLAGVVICSGRFFFRRGSRPVLRSISHTAEGGREETPFSLESKWSGLTSAATRIIAGLALTTALLLSSAHLLLPRCPISPVTTGLARQWCVRPELRKDFDWLTSQPWAAHKPIHILLEHLNLAQLQRGPFAEGLSEAEWRECVLSPVLAGAEADLAWRQDLWEFLAPRVRRETESAAAAQIVVRELRLRVSVQPGNPDTSPAVAWSLGVVNEACRERLLCAMLRSVGVPARLAEDGRCQFWSATGWQNAPIPIIP